ncbi:MAG TPA: hypothetical protein VMM77_08360 [Gemmatimonadaceae bacterium]|nr:hypothetical protein [Gemmatimonadaceae bacterium]
MRTFLSALLASAALACANSKQPAEPNEGEPQPKVVPTNAEFTLRRGESASVGGGMLIVTFLAVENDSRCPVDVVCVWGGDAELHFRLASEKSEAAAIVDTLHTGVEPRAATYLGYTVTVNGLQPYPHSSDEPGSRDYRVALVVTTEG